MNTALIFKDINHSLHCVEVKTKTSKITFPFIGKIKNTDVAFLNKDIEAIFLLNSPTKLSVWDKDHGNRSAQGVKAKKMVDKLGFLLDGGVTNGN